MIKQDINDIHRAVRALERGSKQLAAEYLLEVRERTRSRHIKCLVWSLIDLHALGDEVFEARQRNAATQVAA